MPKPQWYQLYWEVFKDWLQWWFQPCQDEVEQILQEECWNQCKGGFYVKESREKLKHLQFQNAAQYYQPGP